MTQFRQLGVEWDYLRIVTYLKRSWRARVFGWVFRRRGAVTAHCRLREFAAAVVGARLDFTALFGLSDQHRRKVVTEKLRCLGWSQPLAWIGVRLLLPLAIERLNQVTRCKRISPMVTVPTDIAGNGLTADGSCRIKVADGGDECGVGVGQ
jgi:hypothetical protein